MRKPSPRLEDLIADVAATLGVRPAPVRVRVFDRGRVVAAFFHVPTMAGRVAPVIRNESPLIRQEVMR